MRAVRAKYENGAITPIEPVPATKAAEVLVIFLDAKPKTKSSPERELTEEELFGCGKDTWTDEVVRAIRESWVVEKHPRETGS